METHSSTILVDQLYSDAAQLYFGLESSIAMGLKSDGHHQLYNPVDKTKDILDNFGHAAVVSCRNIASLTFQDHDLRVDAFAEFCFDAGCAGVRAHPDTNGCYDQ